MPISTTRAASRRWWQGFWDRSWIHVAGTAGAEKVSQGYIMQRYMMAASSRGPFPVKFNGGLFTVGHDLPANVDSTGSSSIYGRGARRVRNSASGLRHAMPCMPRPRRRRFSITTILI